MRVPHRLATIAVGTAATLTGALIGSPVAHASYGANATQDQWQVGLSFNCNNPSSPYCLDQDGNPSLGGFWGWYVFDSPVGDDQSGTGDAQLTGCGHTQGGGGGGAGHLALDDITWHAGPAGPQSPVSGVPGATDFYIDSYTLTVTGHGPSQSFSTSVSDPFSSGNPDLDSFVNGFLGDSGVTTTPGHYGFHPDTGVAGMQQISFRPGV